MSFSSTKPSVLVWRCSVRWGDGRFLVKVVWGGVKGSFRLPFPMLLRDKALQCCTTEVMMILLLLSWFYIPLYSFIFRCIGCSLLWVFPRAVGNTIWSLVQWICAVGWAFQGCQGFPNSLCWEPGLPVACWTCWCLQQGQQWDYNLELSRFCWNCWGNLWPWTSQLSDIVFFPPSGLREQRYSVRTCCRYCNMLHMDFLKCCVVWAFWGLWSGDVGINTSRVRDGTLDVFDFPAHEKTRVHFE